MSVKKLAADELTGEYIIFLENKKTRKVFPIWIAVQEALVIYLKRRNIVIPRPITHDLLVDVTEGLNAKLQRVIIHSLRKNTYYALLLLDQGGKEVVIDSRPSDAIALSLCTGAPIYVSKQILESKSIKAPPKKDEQDLAKTLLGLTVQNITPDLAKALELETLSGVLVSQVEHKSPCEEEGLRRGDVIVEVNGHKTKNISEFNQVLEKPGTTKVLALKILRKSKTLQLSVEP